MGERVPNTPIERGRFNKEIGDLLPSGFIEDPTEEELLLARMREEGAVYVITKGNVREESHRMLGRELSDEDFDYVLEKFEEYMGWMDWTEYLDEALQSLHEDE